MDDPLSPLARKRKLPDVDDRRSAPAGVQDPSSSSAAAAADQLLGEPTAPTLEAPRRTSSTCWSDGNALWQAASSASSSTVPPPTLVAEPPSPSSPKRPRTESGASIPLSPSTSPSPSRKRTRPTQRGSASVPRRMQRHASAPAAVARSHSPISPVPVDLSSPYIPCLQPLINRETLKELDLEQILRNPQLRHDLLFDSNLQFRPTSGRRKRDLVDNYWRSVLQELENGCTCITLDYGSRIVDLKCACKRIPRAGSQPLLVLFESDRVMTVRMPSRLRPLLSELLEVLLSVIQPLPSTSSGFYMQHPTTGVSGQQHQAEQHAAQAALLRSVLDSDLIEQELKHGLFDPSGLFRVIGETLKCHCAPMRDRAVESMVQIAQTCASGGSGTKADAVKALRMCFEVLEFMKLDIANHQLQTLRPFLVQSSAEFELKTFQERRVHGHLALTTTRQWIEAAHQQLLSVPSPLPYFAASPPSVQLRLIALRAIADLIFVPPSTAPLTPLPPPTTTPTHRPPPAIAPLPGYPETLYLDHSRMVVLSADAADLTSLYMLLMLYRQLVFSSSSKAVPKVAVTDAELQRVKKEIWEVGPSRVGYCFSQGRSRRPRERDERTEEEKEKDRLRYEEKEKKEWKKWHTSMRDVLLQIALRATTARIPGAAATSSPLATPATTPAPDEATVKLVERWADTNLRYGSPLSTLLRDRLRNAVLDVVIENVLKLPPKKSTHPDATAPSPAATMSGLEPLTSEIKHLGERIAKLATIHLNVYGPLYEQNGFMDAAAC
ncbi:Tcp11-domain-containing protein [Punctularia strigosozonata HHB-11173 SS5]|uniref:Tcp11-domain-containing protein n=1 Tax=Punctularia strigosozonata (strain HHB-11173) TaxID=741275 RepID=UPI0004416EA9|nr:Tcp11-domain-containing protein [Punctularia strigosozonata HHB-11173 SS5]EIN12618.1 Tcp11-domain-containing protein [Punctularia strigosozonata HHB-11173 SS5]